MWWAPYLKLAISKSFDQLRRWGLPLVSFVYFGWFASVCLVCAPPTQRSLLDFYPVEKKNNESLTSTHLSQIKHHILKSASSRMVCIYSSDTCNTVWKGRDGCMSVTNAGDSDKVNMTSCFSHWFWACFLFFHSFSLWEFRFFIFYFFFTRVNKINSMLQWHFPILCENVRFKHQGNIIILFFRFYLVFSVRDVAAPTLTDAAFLPEPVQELVGNRRRQLMSDGRVESQSGQGDRRCCRKF